MKQEQKVPDKIDILFVIPPVLRFIEKSSSSAPLGLGYIVSFLKKNGMQSGIYNADIYQHQLKRTVWKKHNLLVKVYGFYKRKIRNVISAGKTLVSSYNTDFAKKWPTYYDRVGNRDDPIWEEMRKTFMKIRPKIVGMGSKVVDIRSTVTTAKIAKEVLPDVKVVVGGPSAATCPEYLMENTEIDYLVNGEGEETMLELAGRILKDADNIQAADIAGITYRNSRGEAMVNPPRPLIEDLDSIPFPDRESMFIVGPNGDFKYIYECGDVLTTRGCPFPCKFCAAQTAWGTKKPRFRNVENVIRELKYLKTTFGQEDFIFWDDLFTINRARTIELCEKIIQSNLDIGWICLARIDTIDAELLALMKKAGCREIQIGIESGSERILKYVGKNIDLAMIRRQIPVIRGSGIAFRIFLVIGFPTETREDIKSTLDIIQEIRPTYVDLSMFCPYPGTDFFYKLKEKGLLGEDFMKSDMWYPYITFTGTMTDLEFREIAFSALRYVDEYNSESKKRSKWCY